ncbi:MAG TPA: YraN family protein [Xylella sp.]
MLSRSACGRTVEVAARHYLEQAGLRWLASNVRFRGGELDLVMHDVMSVVFVEVRYRQQESYGSGAQSVDQRKRRKLVVAAQLFLQRHPELAQAPCRFDVVEGAGTPLQLHWIRDAFRLDDC